MARHPAAVARLWRDRASTTPSGYAAAVRDSLRALRVRLRWPLRRVRLESFGAIVQLAVPRALVFVDRAMARRVARVPERPAAWNAREDQLGDRVLSAPLEAHLQLTNRCNAGCAGCYTGASPQ